MTSQRISPDRLRSFITAVFVAHAVPRGDAELVADTLVQADQPWRARRAWMPSGRGSVSFD